MNRVRTRCKHQKGSTQTLDQATLQKYQAYASRHGRAKGGFSACCYQPGADRSVQGSRSLGGLRYKHAGVR